MQEQVKIEALVQSCTLASILASAKVLISEADLAKKSGCEVRKDTYHAAIAKGIDDFFHDHDAGEVVMDYRAHILLDKFKLIFEFTSVTITPLSNHEDDPSGPDAFNDSATRPVETPNTRSVGALANGSRQGVSGSAPHGVRSLRKVLMRLMPHFQLSSISIRNLPSVGPLSGIDPPFTILRIGSRGFSDYYEAENTDVDFEVDHEVEDRDLDSELGGDGQDTGPGDASEQNDADDMSESGFEHEEQDVEHDALSEQDGVGEADSVIEDDQVTVKSFEMHDAASEPFQGGGGSTAAALIAGPEAEGSDCVVGGGLPTPRAGVTPEFEYPSTALKHSQNSYVVELRDTRRPSASISALEPESVATSHVHAGPGSNRAETASLRDDVIKASAQECHWPEPRIINSVPVLEFPMEILLHVLSYLCLTQILQYRRVCKHFRQLIDNKSNLPLLLAKLPLQISMLDKLASVQDFDILQFDYLETLAELVARRGLWPNKDPYILTIHIMMDLFMRRGVQVNDAARAVTWDAFWKLGYNIWQIHIQHHLPQQGLRCMNWVPCIDVSDFVRRVHGPVLETYGITQGRLNKWYNDLTKTPGGYLRGLSGPRSRTQVARWGGLEIPQFCLTGLYAFDSGISMRPTSVTLRSHYSPPITADASKRLARVLGVAELPTHFEAYGQLFREGYIIAWCARSRHVSEKIKEALTEDSGKELTALEKAIIKEDIYLV